MTTHDTRDASAIWAEYASGVTYHDLPDDVNQIIRWLVLDTLATTLAANTLGIGIPELLAWARGAGGTPECSLLGFGDKLPAAAAAMVNGGMAHALNFDDTTAVGSGHLGPVTFPSAFAAAELKGGASGKELITAIAVGGELMSRIGVAVKKAEMGYAEAKPQPTQMPGFFASAVAASRMLGFDALQTQSALGLAFMQASGGRQPVLDGRPAKAIYAAFSNQGGMQAALLTKHGLMGDCDAFEGSAGYFPTYYGGAFDRPSLVDDLGSTFYLTNVGFKPWPTTGVAHVFIAAASALHAKLALRSDLTLGDIVGVRIAGEPHMRTFCEPSETRRNPKAPVEAEDSVLFTTAKALVTGNVTLSDLQPTSNGLFEPEVIRIANLIEYEIDESLGKSGTVEVTLLSGEKLHERVDIAPGHRDHPLTQDQREQKFAACAALAGSPTSDARVREVVALVDALDEVPDVRVLAGLLSGT
ncbi:MAG: MmgE/PrpD family protein [Chloroflexi bacterium]|nr:MmgE/PrpD family protein [Chloroflexota bacterium]